MHVQVVDFLATLRASVHHNAKAPVRIRRAALLQRKLGGQKHHAAQHRRVLGLHMRHGDQMLLGHDEKMHRRMGMDVVEGKEFFIFKNFARWNRAGANFAKKTIRIVHRRHYRVWVRLPG